MASLFTRRTRDLDSTSCLGALSCHCQLAALPFVPAEAWRVDVVLCWVSHRWHWGIKGGLGPTAPTFSRRLVTPWWQPSNFVNPPHEERLVGWLDPHPQGRSNRVEPRLSVCRAIVRHRPAGSCGGHRSLHSRPESLPPRLVPRSCNQCTRCYTVHCGP